MKAFIRKNILGIAGVFVGAVAGYLYYYFVGCNSGSCAITSSPVNSVLYGMLMGYLILTMFEKDKKIKKAIVESENQSEA
jgi:LytS/YehU family sensor histidine kinase